MIELHLDNTIIAFDGRVLEAFPKGQPASRFHVANVKSAFIKTDRKGRQSFQVQMEGTGGFATAALSSEAATQAQTMLSEILKVRPDLQE